MLLEKTLKNPKKFGIGQDPPPGLENFQTFFVFFFDGFPNGNNLSLRVKRVENRNNFASRERGGIISSSLFSLKLFNVQQIQCIVNLPVEEQCRAWKFQG